MSGGSTVLYVAVDERSDKLRAQQTVPHHRHCTSTPTVSAATQERVRPSSDSDNGADSSVGHVGGEIRCHWIMSAAGHSELAGDSLMERK